MSSTSLTPDEIAVWCDELLERGDPFGQLLVLARRSAASPEAAAMLEDELDALRWKYEEDWFRGEKSPLVMDHYFQSTWERGFLTEVSIVTTFGAEVIRALADGPATRQLRKLKLSVTPFAPGPYSFLEDTNPTDPIQTLVEHGLPLTLEELNLTVVRPARVVAFVGIWPRLPNLRSLVVSCPDLFGDIDLPKLETLYVDRLEASQLEELASARLPALKLLSLDECEWSSLSLLERLQAPNLEEVRLVANHHGWSPEATEALSAVPFLQRIPKVVFE